MIYTSGTTGQPKGALHAHRVLLGHLPGIVMPHGLFPQPGDRFWTPADWAWAGGLLDVLLPALKFGVPVVARKEEKFDPEAAFALMANMAVRNAFIPPTALRMMLAVPRPRERFPFALRSVMSAGETLGAETGAQAAQALGLAIDEAYGQTECNLVVGTCTALGMARPGSMGRPLPGHNVGVIRPDGQRSGARRTRPDRRFASGPRDVPGLLEQRCRDTGQVRRRLDDDRRPGDCRFRRVLALRRA
jgi:acetyl-CoA synthetase